MNELKKEISKFKQSLKEFAEAVEKLDEGEPKQELKPIDLSVLIDSGIDCEFWNSEPSYIMKLDYIGKGMFPYRSGQSAFSYCRPRMNHIHACPNGFDKNPLPNGLILKVYYSDGTYASDEHSSFCDFRHADCNNIIAFEIVGLADGYCWPWEVK